MARQIDPQRVAEFRAAHPKYAVVAYINTTAELKAVSDVCVTSSSALKIVRALPQKDILFIPDKNLGDYVRRQVPEKHIVTWDGYCPVHNAVTAADVQAARRLYPAARGRHASRVPAGGLGAGGYDRIYRRHHRVYPRRRGRRDRGHRAGGGGPGWSRRIPAACTSFVRKS